MNVDDNIGTILFGFIILFASLVTWAVIYGFRKMRKTEKNEEPADKSKSSKDVTSNRVLRKRILLGITAAVIALVIYFKWDDIHNSEVFYDLMPTESTLRLTRLFIAIGLFVGGIIAITKKRAILGVVLLIGFCIDIGKVDTTLIKWDLYSSELSDQWVRSLNLGQTPPENAGTVDAAKQIRLPHIDQIGEWTEWVSYRGNDKFWIFFSNEMNPTFKVEILYPGESRPKEYIFSKSFVPTGIPKGDRLIRFCVVDPNED